MPPEVQGLPLRSRMMSLGSSRRRWASRSSGMRLLPEGGEGSPIDTFMTAPPSPPFPLTCVQLHQVDEGLHPRQARQLVVLYAELHHERQEGADLKGRQG